MHALVFRIHQHPVHVREHFAVVDHAREASELIAIPCADDGAAANQRTVDAVGILGGLPTDRREQFVDLVLREAFLVRVCDCHICRLYSGVYIRGRGVGYFGASCGIAVCGIARRNDGG